MIEKDKTKHGENEEGESKTRSDVNNIISIKRFDELLDKSAQTLIQDELLVHLIRTNTVWDWAKYAVEILLEREYGWENPGISSISWRHRLESEEQLKEWIGANGGLESLQWQKAVCCAYKTAALLWFRDQIDDLYIKMVNKFSYADIKIVSFGGNKGLAIQTSLLCEEEASYIETFAKDHGGTGGVTVEERRVNLGESSEDLVNLIMSGAEGEVLPPFYDGLEWRIIVLVRRVRPTKAEIAEFLIRSEMDHWFNKASMKIKERWTERMRSISGASI